LYRSAVSAMSLLFPNNLGSEYQQYQDATAEDEQFEDEEEAVDNPDEL